MSFHEVKDDVIKYWHEKAYEAIDSARRDFDEKRYSFAASRAYYACFYALTAVLLKEGHKFSKHTGVRSAFHRLLVKTGRVSRELGQFYDLLFDSRQRADYQELAKFTKEETEELITKATTFVDKMKELLID